MNKNFRYDINFLRAVSVILVVVYHFYPTLVPAGFIGVDIFFLLSGFLMTNIIYSTYVNQKFSLIQFYIARFRRIVPPLLVVLVILLIYHLFFSDPLELKLFAKKLASSLLFISNVLFWRESGYFDEASQSNMLLHTWSLSVEWQFYIIYPLILAFIIKYFGKNIALIISTTTIVIYVISVIITHTYPNAGYFLLPTRSWEMLIGGVAFLISRRDYIPN